MAYIPENVSVNMPLVIFSHGFGGTYMSGDTYDVLIIHGDEDTLVPLSYSERAVTEYPSAELKVIEGGEHGFRGNHNTEAINYIIEYIQKYTN